MIEGCIPISELAEQDSWPPDDSRHSHLESCPRCQSLLLSYTTFTAPPDIPVGADVDDARARLSTSFCDKKTENSAPALESKQQPTTTRASLFDTIFDFLLRPPVRFAMGGAVIILLVIGLPRLFDEPRFDPDTRILRDSEPPAGSRSITTAPPVRASDGVLLTWRPAAEVDSYQVLFFDSGFTEIASFNAGLDTMLTLTLDGLSVPNDEWSTVFWRVSGRRGADEVVHSQMMSLDLLE